MKLTMEDLYRHVMMTLFGHPLYWLGWWALTFVVAALAAACGYAPGWSGLAVLAAFSLWYWRIIANV